MRLGGPVVGGLGDPRKHMEYCLCDQVGQALRLRFKPVAGMGDAYFAIHVQTEKVANVYAREGVESSLVAPLPFGESVVAVAVFRLGRVGDLAYNAYRVARSFQSEDARRVVASFPWTPEVVGEEDDANDYASAWSLAGLVYGINCAAIAGRATRATLDVLVENDSGAIAVTLSRLGVVVAYGSATYTVGPSVSVTLAAVGSSGLSGSVTVSTSAPATWSANLVARWPASMQILRGTSSPPSAVVATVPFDGQTGGTWREPNDLAAGVYYYAFRTVSDTGVVGIAAEPLSVTIPGAPAPPVAIAYKSGTAAATVLSLTKSPTAGATYRAYVAAPGAAFDFGAIGATAGVNATEITLPAITGYPGTARVIVRAVSSGVEEQNIDALELEYGSGGAYVPKRPNGCRLDAGRAVVSQGTVLNAVAVYDPANQAAAPTGCRLFVRSPGAAYNYATPDASGSWVDKGGMFTAALTVDLAIGGHYFIQAVPYNTDGLALVAGCPEIPVYASGAQGAAPSGSNVTVARG